METMNKVFLMGRLGADPQTHLDKRGLSFVRLSIGTNKWAKDTEGKETQKAEWHSVLVWGQRAETCMKYLKKGSPVLVEGVLSTYSREKEAGGKEWKSNIRALRVSFLPGGLRVTEQEEASREQGFDDIFEDSVDSEDSAQTPARVS